VLLSPVSLAEEPLIPTRYEASPTEPDLLPSRFNELAHRLGLGSDDADSLVVGHWPMMEQPTLDVFRRLKLALGTAEGRPETVVARHGMLGVCADGGRSH
jgi:hypothetical protein